METKTAEKLKDRAHRYNRKHKRKSGTVRDLHASKTGHITTTVEQKNGVRFKALARSVTVQS